MAVFGRNKESTLSQKITMGSVETLNLPRNSVHDAYILKFDMDIENSTSAEYTINIRKVLESIEEIRLVTDSIRVHYAVNGYDLALLNAKIQPVQTNDILTREDVKIPAGQHQHYVFNLYLDEGDIIAVAHNNVELNIHWNGESLGTNITITSATCEVTLLETIYSAAQLQALYGENWENIVEPKVYALTTTAPGNTEFTGNLDLPTGTLLRGAIIEFTPSDATSTNPGTFPKQVGILRTVPDRVELGKTDFESHRMKDEIIYKTTFPKGVFIYDYGKQWQSNGIGKDGWSYAKGDVQLATLNGGVEQKIRYISLESLVNTSIYSQNYAFTTY